MSFAYLPLYTGDYLRDTRGLSMAGHGAYLLLLAFCWDTRGPLPLDMEEIATICGARSQEERSTMEKVVTRYFVRMSDGHYNRRMQREIERCNVISDSRSEAGRRGANERMRKFRDAEANAKQMLSKSQALAKQVTLTPSPSPTLSPAPSPEVKTTLSGSSPTNTDAVLLLEFLNRKTGRKFRPTPTTLKPILARLKEYSFDECKAVIVRRWVAWRDDDRMRDFLRPETLFGASKFAQYVGDVPLPSEIEDAKDQTLPGL